VKIFLVFVLRASAGLAAFIFNIVLARTLGADGAGTFALVYSTLIIVVICARFGIDRSLLKLVASHGSANEWPKVRGAYNSGRLSVLLLSMGLTIGLYFGAVPISAFYSDVVPVSTLRLVSLAIIPVAMIFLHAEALKGLKRVNLSLLLNGIMIPFLAVCLLLTFDALHVVDGAVLAYLIAAFITATSAFFLWNYYDRRSRSGDSFEHFSCLKILSASFPLFIVTLALNLQGVIPIFFLGHFSESKEIALFNAAVKTALMIGMILQAVNAHYAPRFAALYYKKETEKLERTARKAVLLPAAVATPILLLLMAFPKQIMGLFGEEFVAAAPLLMIVAAAQFINVATGPVAHLLMMSDHGKAARNTALLGMLVSLAFCFLLIPEYGAFGAAIAHSLGLAIRNLVGVSFVKRYLGIKIWSFL